MDLVYLQDAVAVYFSRIFPFNDFFKWLSYGEDETFSHREFAFNFQGDRYLRYQSYPQVSDLKYAVKTYHPIKIDIGAIYNIIPSRKNLSAKEEISFYPVQKELIFDIDVTDYDEVRTCCSGADICSKCWKYMAIAIKILDTAMREDFGFQHILWVFSGRRGIHCWICDKRARFLKMTGRFGVANYLQLVTGGNFKKKKVEINNKIHHSVKRALAVIEPLFVQMCVEEQNMLGTEERILKFLGIIDNDEMRSKVRKILDEHSTSLTRWEAFIKFFKNQLQLESKEWCKTPFLIEEIMLQYAYPRLDINVSLGMSHLLKSPFSIHPKTGKIGVPIDTKSVEKMNPDEIPTISKLLDEIDVFDIKMKKQGMSLKELRNIEDIKKTSLNDYLTIFHEFLDGLEKLEKN